MDLRMVQTAAQVTINDLNKSWSNKYARYYNVALSAMLSSKPLE
jgi:hypothetical protein